MSDATDPGCPEGPFETDLAKIEQTPPRGRVPVADLQDADQAVPPEVSRIVEGAASCFRGGLMNEGVVTWYAFDVPRQLFVAVLTSARDVPGRVPHKDKLSRQQLLRYTGAAGYRRGEFVTLGEATPAQVRQFGCLANLLLATPEGVSPGPVPAGALSRTLALMKGGKQLDFGPAVRGSGELERFLKAPLQDAILSAY